MNAVPVMPNEPVPDAHALRIAAALAAANRELAAVSQTLQRLEALLQFVASAVDAK
jgi:hypothetical protein